MPAEDQAILAAYREDILASAGSTIAGEPDLVEKNESNSNG